ncbi:uncharacterized protein JCM15063_004949 [Sporobolomyces koalae]|uniref:uncharacterized protein n=1 Tax=Sporobolomyces koalae TaxID=500713 RepID=UPI00316C86EA
MPVLVPDSLETQPPSPAMSRPSAMAGPARAKPPTRTYGKRTMLPDTERHADADSLESNRRDQHQTVVVPETDPDIDMERDNDAVEHDSRSSSLPPSEPRSTSPTSTEEDEPQPARKATKSILADLSDDSSADEDEEQADSAIDFFKRHGNLDDQLRAIDREIDDRDDAHAQTVKRNVLDVPTSSSLPPLTDSDALSRAHSSSQPTPSARPSTSIRIADPSDDYEEDSQAVVAPSARPRKSKARIADSEDEDDETATVAGQAPAFERSEVSEGDVGSSSPVRSALPAPTLSKQERLLALAARKKAERAPSVSPPRPQKDTSSIIFDASSSDEERSSTFAKKKAKKLATKPRTKALSKKVEDEMHKQSAAFAREQEARLEPVLKSRINVVDTLKKNRSNRQATVAPVFTSAQSRRADHVLVLSSSDTIVDTSSPQYKLNQPSAKALGKQREHSPIEFDDDTTPRARRRLPIARPDAWGKKKLSESKKASSSDSEEDLPSLEELEARKERDKLEKIEKEKERLEKRRVREALIKEARAKAALEDDSDLEIEGLPMAPPRPPPAPRRTGSETNRPKTSAPRPGTQLNHVMRDFARVDPSHDPAEAEEATDSQFAAAAKEFGRNLMPTHQVFPASAVGNAHGSRHSTKSKANQRVDITKDELERKLIEKSRMQAIQARLEKSSNHRRLQAEQAGPERLDVQGMLQKKQKQAQEQQAEDAELEELDDPDYQAGIEDEEEDAQDEEEAQFSDDGDEVGSGSDAPVPTMKRGKVDFEEGEFDSDGELVMPASSQNSDRLGQRDSTQAENEDEAEHDEDDLPVARRTNVKPRVVIDDDEEEAEEAQIEATVPATEIVPTHAPDRPSAEPVRIALDDFMGGGGDEGGGFSQFFNSQFSQDAAAANNVEGFGRPAEPTPFGNLVPTMIAPQPLISTAERAADAALLEARGAVHNIEPGTPREAAIPRQYINKQGFMTQTRPVNLFGDSPSFSPRDSQMFRESLSSAQDSQTQRYTQTQVDATPTQAARHPNQLRRQHALVRDESLSELQPEPTEVIEEESFPSAAQPPSAAPRNAFTVLRQARTALEAVPEQVPTKRRREMNAFVDDQANLDSDEEQAGGLNAASGDEDEEGHDAELEELVDNQAISEELQAVQDTRARELHQEELDKREAADLKRAQNIADGKERNKRKGYDLDDDDFDDEFRRQEHREKKARIDNMTTTELLANDKTRAFAEQLRTTCVAVHRDGDLDMFEQSQRSDQEGDGDDDDIVEETQEEDVFGGVRVQVKTTHVDIRAEAIRKQREYDEAHFDSQELESQLELEFGDSSPPVAGFKVNNRIHAAMSASALVPNRKRDEYEDIESQYSLGRVDSFHSLVNYKSGDTSSSREESQGGGNGVAVGGRSAVTSFKKGPSRQSSTSSTTSLASTKGASKNNLSRTGSTSRQSSKFSAIRKGGFAS